MTLWTSLIPFNNSPSGKNLQAVINELQTYLRPWRTFTVSLSGSNTTILHGLSRQPLGWVVIDKTGYADIKRISWDSSSVVLVAESSVTATIMIF